MDEISEGIVVAWSRVMDEMQIMKRLRFSAYAPFEA